MEWLVLFFQWIVIIAQLEFILVISADFLDAQIFCVGESYDLGLVALLVKKVVFGSCEGVFL